MCVCVNEHELSCGYHLVCRYIARHDTSDCSQIEPIEMAAYRNVLWRTAQHVRNRLQESYHSVLTLCSICP